MNEPGFVAIAAEGRSASPAEVGYGLRRNALSPLEVLAQSVAAIAPSTIPVFAVPLVFALAGNGAWLAFVIAMVAMMLVAFCIAVFARDTSSPGSLYVYVRNTLPQSFAAPVAWGLLFAYVTTASAGMGAMMSFFLRWNVPVPPVLAPSAIAFATFVIVYREVKVSIQIMLWVEAVSTSLILIVLLIALWKVGLHFDAAQLHLTGATISGVRLGVMLAIFGFVGFESATALGAEARDPLHNIPRSVLRSAMVAGLFFIVCCYTETVAFRSSATSLADSTTPMRFLASQGGVPLLGILIDAGVLVSLFSGVIACTIASARILMLMAHHGHLPIHLAKTHTRNDTPVVAALFAVIAMAVLVTALTLRGTTGADLYGFLGTISVFGYLTGYGLVALAMPIHLYRRGRLRCGGILLALGAALVILAAFIGTIYPVPPAPYRYLPWIYVAYLAAGMIGSRFQSALKVPASSV